MSREQREAERQGRAAYAAGKPRNERWPLDFLAAYDAAAADDAADAGEIRRPARPLSSDGQFFKAEP